jgi:hypothetical protein
MWPRLDHMRLNIVFFLILLEVRIGQFGITFDNTQKFIYIIENSKCIWKFLKLLGYNYMLYVTLEKYFESM